MTSINSSSELTRPCTCNWISTVENGGKSTMATKFSADEQIDSIAVCDIVYNTMKALKFVPLARYDHPLLPAADAYWDSLPDLDAATKARILQSAKGSVAMGDLMYPFLPRDARLAVGIYTTYIVWLDDFPETEDLASFRKYCTSDRNKLSIPLRHFADYIDTFASNYGPYAADGIWCATFGFVNAIIAEQILEKGVAVPRSATLFPDFMRRKSGVSEAYSFALFCEADLPEDEWLIRKLFVIPNLLVLFDSGNDTMSFYKEHVIGEKSNYIWTYSCCHDISLLDGLKVLASRMVNSIEHMRITLADQPELLSRVEALVMGYMRWHWLFRDRYHLQDLFKLHDGNEYQD